MSNINIKPKIFVILGPTAIGKSSLAFRLAKKCDASIINADSLQVYKYLDIGTSKPTSEERNAVPHYMIDILEPDQEFNAANFKLMAEQVIKKLSEENKKIILVGGTFLYVKILLSGLIGESDLNTDIRKMIEEVKDTKGLLYLYRILMKVDKTAGEKINPNDYIRIQRALEVYFSSGVKISDLQNEHNFETNNYNICKIGLQMERSELYERINLRVEEMLEKGFIEEVENIINMGFDTTLKPMKSIGYKELGSYLSGVIDKDSAVNLIKQNTRKYAKRQSTWLRKEADVSWYSNETNLKIFENKFNQFFSI